MDRPMLPEQIPFEKLTIVNYAFFYPLADGSIVGRNPAGDSLLLDGVGRPSGNGLVALAHRHGVKVLPSLGGWEESHHFPAVAASAQKRGAFARACVELIERYGFDGIDIDWEFPGYADHNGTPDDRVNFTSLLRQTKDSLTALGKRNNKQYLLTAALPAGAAALKEYEIEKVADILDMLNIMTYDFNGSWSPKSGHNAPLFASNAVDLERNIDASLMLYAERLRLPLSKINLGVPFYGHTYTGCQSMNAPHSGPDTVHFSPHGAFYYDIRKIVTAENRRWDTRAKVPYLVIPEWKTVISYDDEESVREKARYAKHKNVRGLIIWEITGDFLEDGSTPLLDVIHQEFNGQ